MQELIIAGGTESMSCMPMGGWRIVPNARVAQENPDWYWGMGLTAEAVANEFKVSREAQDAFAVRSHERAAAAIDNGRLQAGIAPIAFTRVDMDGDGKRRETQVKFEVDEGVRRGTNMEGLAKLRPVFAAGGSVTAGNSSQTSDGAAFVMVASERMVKELGVERSYQSCASKYPYFLASESEGLTNGGMSGRTSFPFSMPTGVGSYLFA